MFESAAFRRAAIGKSAGLKGAVLGLIAELAEVMPVSRALFSLFTAASLDED
jgi:hypothetical protein